MILEGIAGDDTQTQLEFIRKAFESNERQIHIVDNLLKVAQIDAGKLVLNKTPVDLRVLLNSIIEDNAEVFSRRKQKVNCEVSKGEIIVNVDTTHFRMALDNIIDNASKYTPEGGLIKVSVSRKGKNAAISIKDNGVGIAPADLSLLFKKFSRIPNYLSDSVGGTGLGLYWVGKVIELHGGKIDVVSAVEKGTTFTITVPQGDTNA